MQSKIALFTRTCRCLTIALMFSVTSHLYAQSSAGGGVIQGTVKDATEALMPGAKITIRNLATGVVTNSIANSEGFFITPSLTIGKYKVRVEAQGMKAWEQEVLVETGRTVEVMPLLAAGQVTETIVIEGSIAPLVTTTEPTEGSTLDRMRIEEIPINGRNINTLIENVTPGVEAINDVNGGVRISGLMVYSTNYVQDGATSNNREFGGSGIMQGLESIGEVKIETSSSSAKYTTPTSVIVTSRGGTNKIHGSLYETHRNNAFGVARARQDVLIGQDYQIPKLIRNEFGGSIHGPVVIPGWFGNKPIYDGHNRTFFFFSREGVRLRQGITREFAVPTAAMRQGDFSGAIDAQGRLLVIYDPLTTRCSDGQPAPCDPRTRPGVYAVRDAFPGNRIPISRISPLAKYMFGITPLPNDIANPVFNNNLKVPVPTNAFPNREDNPMVVRIDHKFTEKDNFFIKVNGGNQFAYFLGTAAGNGAPTTNNEANVTYLPMSGIAGAMSWTHTFSPNFFLETLFNRTWQSTRTITGPPDQQKDFAKELGLPNNFGEVGWPNMTSLGLYVAATSIGTANNYSYIEGDNRRALYSIITNLEQNYTWVKRTHNVQFGGRFSNERSHLLPDQGGISGTSFYNSLATSLQNPSTSTNPGATAQTGYDTANFFLGYGARYDVGLKRGFMQVYEKRYGLYFQDNWKVSNRLTVNPGLRWDINPAFHERNGLLSGFNQQTHSLLLPESLDYYYKIGATTPQLVSLYQAVGIKFQTAAEAGQPKNLFKSNLYDLSPRAGFSYRLFDGDKQMVLRGGYGIYTSAIAMRTLLAQFSGLLPFRATFSYNPNTAATSPDLTQNYLIRSIPTVTSGLNSANIVPLNNPGAIGRGQSVVGMDINQPSMRIHEWNLLVEKQLNKTTVFRLTYTGKHGVNADQLFEINPQPSNYIHYKTTQTALPGGTFANVALRIFDKEAYTSVRILQKSGYINSSTWTAQIERRFSQGLGFQLFYTLTNTLRQAGNSFRDDVKTTYHPSLYLPNTFRSTDVEDVNRDLFYDRDTAVPKHRIRWNWNYDLPFGKGKWLLGKASGALQNMVGGWKLSGTGTILNTWFTQPTNQWGEFGKFEVYGKKYKILDCRATPLDATTQAQERCTPGYFWFNGYISSQVIDRKSAAGIRTGVFGLPSNYQPAQKPLIPFGAAGYPTADYDTNVEYIPLINSAANAGCNPLDQRTAAGHISCQRIARDTGYHPWRNQYRLGPFNWVADISLLKFFPIKERFKLRLNLDLFNMFNVQGFNTPNAEGIVSLANSYNPNNQNGFKPRQLQGGLRFEW